MLRDLSVSRVESSFRPMPLPILKRTAASRPSGWWNDDDYDVLAAAGYNFRRLLVRLSFLLLRILIALGPAAQLKLP
jgi:hypothetical protein